MSVAGVHTVQTDVEFHSDAAPQVVAAAGELKKVRGQWETEWNLIWFLLIQTYNIDKSREKDDDDGENTDQGAV